MSMQLYEDAAGVVLRETVPRIVNVTQPAAGAEWSVTVPGGSMWFVNSILHTLVASAAAGVRLPILQITDGTTAFARVPAGNSQAINSTGRFTWLRGITNGPAIAGNTTTAAGFPSIPLFGGYVISTVTTNLDVADQYSAIALYVLEVEERPFDVELEMDLAALRQWRSNAFPQIPLGS